MESHNSSLGTWDYDYSSYLGKALFADSVVTYIVISSGVPLCAVAVYVLYSLVRHGGAPALVYLFNLLISDIVQIICLILIISPLPRLWNLDLVSTIHSFCVVARVAFMVCIALERYLLVSRPLCFCFKRPTRTSVVVSVLVWILCAVVYVGTIFAFVFSPVLGLIIIVFLFLLPVPLFIFCLAATLGALSACRLPAEEKRRIVAVLVLVLLIYTLFFLTPECLIFYNLAAILVKLNPLADLVLCVFMRKGAVDKLLASVCRCKMNGGDSSIPSA